MKRRKKHAGGRPRIDPDSVASFHLGLRFSDNLKEGMLLLVKRENERLAAEGMPARVTPSSLARMWIEERMLQEMKRLREEPTPPPKKSIYDWIRENPFADNDDKTGRK